MLDLFAAAPKDLREAKLREYKEFLIERDGDENLTDFSLSKREGQMKRFETRPPITRELNEADFRRQYKSFDKRKPPSEEMIRRLRTRSRGRSC
jgi:hypothetical protein